MMTLWVEDGKFFPMNETTCSRTDKPLEHARHFPGSSNLNLPGIKLDWLFTSFLEWIPLSGLSSAQQSIDRRTACAYHGPTGYIYHSFFGLRSLQFNSIADATAVKKFPGPENCQTSGYIRTTMVNDSVVSSLCQLTASQDEPGDHSWSDHDIWQLDSHAFHISPHGKEHRPTSNPAG
jgi:hypothetical protein